MFHRFRDDRGAMLVVMAISMVAMLALSGLVIDGGRAYANRREVQNSADAAALAGAGALNGILFSSTGQEKLVYDAVATSATANGVNTSFDCQLWGYNAANTMINLGACPTSNTGAGLDSRATAVRVSAVNTQGASFIKVVGIGSFSAKAPARAQIQALIGGNAPFMVCGLDAAHDGYDPPLLVKVGSDYVFNTGQTSAATAIGQEYVIHDTHVAGCGGGSGWKGLVDQSGGPYDLGDYWPAKTGDTAGPVRVDLTGPKACHSTILVGCQLILPVGDASNGLGGSNYKMHVARMGVFEITYADSNTHRAKFIGGSTVASGGAGGGKPTANEARVIKLSE
jgi:hypothetical protein